MSFEKPSITGPFGVGVVAKNLVLPFLIAFVIPPLKQVSMIMTTFSDSNVFSITSNSSSVIMSSYAQRASSSPSTSSMGV